MTIELIAAFALGLAIGSLGMFFPMDRRVQQARTERDRALDMQNVMAHRPPVMAVTLTERAAQEKKEVAAMKKGLSPFGELNCDEVGDERVDDGGARAPAGIDPAVLEG
jgi:hypothetical protein